MKIAEKLKIILNLGFFTQEKLAQRLGVSFVTLNSWIKERSTPHKKKQVKIDQFYLLLSGNKKIPSSLLQAKKELIEQKSLKHKNVLEKILKYPDLQDQFILSLTYHTNSIEGSTLTENETARVIFAGKSLPDKTLVEQLEAKNHQTALRYLFRFMQSNQKIEEDLFLKLHSILMNSIRDDAGLYRRHGVRIVGANVPTSNFLKIPALMNKLVLDINKQKKDAISHIAEIHSRFEKIHPFADGNGRVGRLIIHAMALRKNLPPSLIKQEDKNIYYAALNKAQSSSDQSILEDFIIDSFLNSFCLMDERNK